MVDLYAGEFEEFTSTEIQEHILPQYNYSMTVDELDVVRELINTHQLSYDSRGVSTFPNQRSETLYPTKSDVLDLCERVDSTYKGNTRITFYRAMNRLQRRGVIKVAEIESGETYVVYPRHSPDPPNAEWVRCNGEKHQPQKPKSERAIA
jgi:hypothetical protein